MWNIMNRYNVRKDRNMHDIQMVFVLRFQESKRKNVV